MTKKIDKWVLITGLLCITGLELAALSQGIDGKVLTAVIAIIAFVLGIKLPTPKILK